MKNTFKLALRGLLRNRRRSLVTLLAIAFGFSAIALFAGYTHNVYDGLSRQSIHDEMIGHLTVSKRGMRQEGKLDPERYMLTQAEVDAIGRLLRDEPHVELVAPRLALSGLLSNGRASTIFTCTESGARCRISNIRQRGWSLIWAIRFSRAPPSTGSSSIPSGARVCSQWPLS